MAEAGEAEPKKDCEERCRELERRLQSLNEVIAPFVFHGKAMRALQRDDVVTVVSKVESSYLCVGAFKNLMEEVDPEEFGLQEENPGRRIR